MEFFAKAFAESLKPLHARIKPKCEHASSSLFAVADQSRSQVLKTQSKMSMIMKSSVSKAAVKASAPKANKMMVWQPYNNK